MKRDAFMVFYFLLLHCFSLHAQTIQSQILIGKIDSIYSNELNELRRIIVYIPTMTNNEGPSSKRYPVLYLFDGEDHFLSTVGMIQQLSQVNGNTVFPEMIVVGITNTNRDRDLTPAPYPNDSSRISSTGGGEKFTAFIENELIPYINSQYPTQSYRILVGHSFGGLMVINTLVNHSKLFNSYVAIDPSMWEVKKNLFKKYIYSIQNDTFYKKKLFVAMANTFGPQMDTVTVREDTTQNTEQARYLLSFLDVLKRNTSNGLKWSWKYYPDDNHPSVPLIAQYDALHFIFKDLILPSTSFLFDNTLIADSIVIKHYSAISQEYGYEILPSENVINNLGYLFLDKKIYDKSYAFFAMNIKNYPNSPNVFDSMGDYYIAVGDKEKAIDSYSKAYSINKWPETKNKLEKLRKEK